MASPEERLSDANLEYHAKSGTYDLASMAQELIELRANERERLYPEPGVVAHSKSQQRRFDAQGVKWVEPASREASRSVQRRVAAQKGEPVPEFGTSEKSGEQHEG